MEYNENGLRGKFIAINDYIKKIRTSQVNNIMMHLIVSEKQEQVISKTRRRKEIIKIKAELNEMENKTKLKK
jgi:hypothetical protein